MKKHYYFFILTLLTLLLAGCSNDESAEMRKLEEQIQ